LAAAWDRQLAVNLTGVFLTMKHEIGHMRANGGGVIINTASSIGAHMRLPFLGAYAATKAAVSALTRTAAREYIADGIRVNAISLGPIETPMSLRPGETEADRDQRLANALPVGRAGTVTEAAAAVLWLASPRPDSPSGTTSSSTAAPPREAGTASASVSSPPGAVAKVHHPAGEAALVHEVKPGAGPVREDGGPAADHHGRYEQVVLVHQSGPYRRRRQARAADTDIAALLQRPDGLGVEAMLDPRPRGGRGPQRGGVDDLVGRPPYPGEVPDHRMLTL